MFVEHFRVSRNVYNQLEEKIMQSPYFNAEASGGNGKLTASYFILVFLWFCGHQTASFRDVSDRFDISLSSLYRIIGKMTDFLSEMVSNVIKWPNLIEKQETEIYFRGRGFPGVIGVIDGTHIKIDKPSEDPDSYLNRKHFFLSK
uniref:Nuclease HARBI1 n=1 Tax=Diabrotica virgifera virgifera TaxID=50390 RepID=A0A6P7GBI3_DIAVI